jgi:hypothetical protein
MMLLSTHVIDPFKNKNSSMVDRIKWWKNVDMHTEINFFRLQSILNFFDISLVKVYLRFYTICTVP